MRDPHRAAGFFQERAVFSQREDIGELHEGSNSARPPRLSIRRPFHPVGEGDFSAGFEQAGRLGNHPRLVLHVTPGVFAPDKINLPGRHPVPVASAGTKEIWSARPSSLARWRPSSIIAGVASTPVIARHFAEARQKSHARAGAAAQVNPAASAGDASAVGKIERGLKAAE